METAGMLSSIGPMKEVFAETGEKPEPLPANKRPPRELES